MTYALSRGTASLLTRAWEHRQSRVGRVRQYQQALECLYVGLVDQLIHEIRAALKAGAYTLALQGTLACIDICAALSSADGRTTGSHFRTWFDAHLSRSYGQLSAIDAYKLRCGLLHQGRASTDQYEAIVFTLPDGRGNVFHNNIINNALNLDLMTFCADVLDAASAWWESARHEEPVASNARHLVRVRAAGLAPYIVGVPVLA